MDERKLTKEEWRLEQAKADCSVYGHKWTFTETFAGPTNMYCERRCGVEKRTLIDKRELEDDITQVFANIGPLKTAQSKLIALGTPWEGTGEILSEIREVYSTGVREVLRKL